MPNRNAPPLSVVWGQHEPDRIRDQLAQLPSGLLCTSAQPDSVPPGWRWLAITQDDPAEILRRALDAEPDCTELLLINAATTLPESATERLQKAFDQAPDALAISALDNTADRLSPLSATALETATDPLLIDRLAFNVGGKSMHQTSCIGLGASLWRNTPVLREELTESLDLNQLTTNLLGAGQTLLAVDHLYVAVGGAALRRDHDSQPDPLDLKRATVAAALGIDAAQHGPAYFGLSERPVALHLLHSWGGGVAQWVIDICASQNDRDHLCLVAWGKPGEACGQYLKLHAGSPNGPLLRSIALPQPIASTAIEHHQYRQALQDLIADYGVTQLVVSSFVGHSLDALRTGLPTQLMLHDFYPSWPLLDICLEQTPADGFSEQALQTALNSGHDRLFQDRQARHWRPVRDALLDTLAATDTICTAPGHAVVSGLRQIDQRWASQSINVIGHGIDQWPRSDYQYQIATDLGERKLRLLVPGRISDSKGKQLLLAALPELREIADIYLLGAGKDGEDFFGLSGVHVILQYQRDQLPELVDQIRPDLALLLSTVSETFSYTLSEMQALGLPVLGTAVGSLRDRLTSRQRFAPNVDNLVDALRAISAQPTAMLEGLISHEPTRSLQEMAHDHSLAFGPVSGSPSRYRIGFSGLSAQALAAKNRQAERLQHNVATQASALAKANEELQRRGDWGFALQRKLKRQTAWASSLEQELNQSRDSLAQLRGEFEERTDWALSLDQQLQALSEHHQVINERYETMISSRSWRLTKPLRFAARLTRRVLQRVGFASRRAKTIAKRTQHSLQVRGVRGTVDRISEEFKRKPMATDFQPPQVAETNVEQALHFARPERPTASIVIPVYNQFHHTWGCLKSLLDTTTDISFEVIVVDDASSDETEQRLCQFSGITYLRNEQNLGFIGSCNRGAEAATGDYVVMLNNDTAVGANWLDALVDTFETHDDAGLVGAKLVYPDGSLQEAGGIVFSDGSGWNFGRNGDPNDPAFNYVREVDYCSGAAIMLRRNLWERFGGFDTRYAPAYYEDTDLAMQVRQAGLKCYIQPSAIVTHFEGVTSGTDTSSGTKRYQVINQEKFVEKWQTELQAKHPQPGDSIRAARDHRASRQALIIDACTPTPDQDSGSVRMTNLMLILRELGYQVSFLADNRAFLPGYTEPLQQLGIEMLYQPFVPSPAELLKTIGPELDVVILSRHYIASQYIELVRWHCKQAQILFDTVDLHYLREERLAKLENDAKLLARSEQTKTDELGVARRCDTTLVVSPYEVQVLAETAPDLDVKVLSNIHPLHGCRRPFASRRDIFFIGGFQHPPNIDAVEWFTGKVWPLIRAKVPQMQLYIIGSKAPKRIEKLAEQEGVLVKGFVENIEPYLDGCKLTVAPLRYGAGVKGKVNMSMSYGQPVVATSPAVEGMGVQAGHDVLVADEPEAFAQAVIDAYNDESLWNTLSTNGLENVEQLFSFDAARRALQKILH